MRRVGAIAIVSVLITGGFLGLIGFTSDNVSALDWIVEVVDSTPGVGRFTSLALDDQGFPHISYHDDVDRDLKYARWDGSIWNVETVDTQEYVGHHTSIALDDKNHPHISYYDTTNARIKYAIWNGTAWRIDVVDTRVVVYGGGFTSIVLNDSMFPHISYILDYSLRLAVWDGADWNVEIIDTIASVGHYSSLALNKSGYPHISHYLQDTHDLRYANWTGTAWNKYSIDETNWVGKFTSIALDSREYPHISYYDNTSKNLKYAYWENNAWIISTVDNTDHCGLFTSIEIDSNDNPHISYHEYFPDHDLMYARWDGSTWIIETVDDIGDTGWYTSLELDKYDNPHISYFDYSNWVLKYARSIQDKPSYPQNLQATANDARVTLTWDPPASEGASPITNYRIYRGTSPGGETFLTEIGIGTTHTDLDVMNGQTYYYMVSAKNSQGEGPKSNEVSTTPTPPPGAPTILSATLVGLTLEHVNIEWTLSSDDGGGYDSVTEYELSKGTTYDASGIGYSLLASLPPGTTFYFDVGTGEGNPNNYFYRLCVRNFNNQSICASHQAGKSTRTLQAGVNLISIPLQQSDSSLEAVLQTVEFQRAWAYDSDVGKWKSYISAKPYAGDHTLVNHSIGMWVDVTLASNLTVAGIVPLDTVIRLNAGWNLVGFPSFSTTYTVSDLKVETGAIELEGFNPSDAPYFLERMIDGDSLQAGHGYWVRAEAKAIWLVTNG